MKKYFKYCRNNVIFYKLLKFNYIHLLRTFIKYLLTMKKCSKCNKIKKICEFYKHKSTKDGLYSWCKSCYKEYYKKYYKENKQEIKKRSKKWKYNNPDKVKEKRKRFKKRHPNYMNNYIKKRRQRDPMFRLNDSISSLIYQSLKENKNGWYWENLVNYTCDELKGHLEKQFTSKMSWENYGSYWHVDHIIPRSYFDFESPDDEEFKKCWALSNLQPLQASKNLEKSDKIIKVLKK